MHDQIQIQIQRQRLLGRMFNIDTTTDIGRYEISHEVGRGAMGIVYEARDRELDRKVALKMIIHSGIPELAERFMAEARAMARLPHPNIVTIYELGNYEGMKFIAMEFIEGLNLKQWLDVEHRKPKEVLEVMRAAGEGLAYAHEKGWIHRDFKPSNVMVGADGRARVMDFGLARLDPNIDATIPMSTTSAPSPPPTPSGTPAYMAPETVGSQWTDQISDQFSYCVTLYEAIYGRRPFEISKTLNSIDYDRLHEPKKRRGVRRVLWPIVSRGLALDRDQRFASMRTLLDEMDACVAGNGQNKRRHLRRRLARLTPTPLATPLAGLGLLAVSVAMLTPHIKDMPSLVNDPMCRVHMLTIDHADDILQIEIIDLRSNEILEYDLEDGETIVFKCRTSSPIEVEIKIEYRDGTMATWVVKVHPMLSPQLNLANAQVTANPYTIGSTTLGYNSALDDTVDDAAPTGSVEVESEAPRQHASQPKPQPGFPSSPAPLPEPPEIEPVEPESATLESTDPQLREPSPNQRFSASELETAKNQMSSGIQSCGQKYKAKPGETVNLWIEVDGATGRVVNTSAVGAIADKPLGVCVEHEAAKVRFGRFEGQKRRAQLQLRVR